MEERALEKLLRDTLQKLGVKIRIEELEDGGGGFCRLDSEPLVVLSPTSSRKQHIQVFLRALKQIDTAGIFLPPAVRDLLEEDE